MIIIKNFVFSLTKMHQQYILINKRYSTYIKIVKDSYFF